MIILKNWSIFSTPHSEYLHLQGNAYGHPKFKDGTLVCTSRIANIVDKGDHKEVYTETGSVYYLSNDDIDPKYEKMHSNYSEKFNIYYV